jgi:Phage integrase, N-terminal SAM-like domain
MSEKTISPLRQRMIEDMSVRNFVEKTRNDYIRHVKTFTAFLGRSPETATPEALRRFQLHQTLSRRHPACDAYGEQRCACDAPDKSHQLQPFLTQVGYQIELQAEREGKGPLLLRQTPSRPRTAPGSSHASALDLSKFSVGDRHAAVEPSSGLCRANATMALCQHAPRLGLLALRAPPVGCPQMAVSA